MEPKFKKEDIVKPSGLRKSSNEIYLEHLILAEVIRDSTKPNWEKEQVTIKILEGSARSKWGSPYKKGDSVTIYTDALEMAFIGEPDYDLY